MRSPWPIACFILLVTLTRGGAARAEDTDDACINASEKAVTLSKSNKLIEARGSLSACAASNCPEPVRTSCRQRVQQIIQAIPSIVFVVKDGTGQDLASVKVTIDGGAGGDHVDANAIVLDPGEHEFRFEAAGREPVVKRFVLHRGEQNRHEDIVIGVTPPTPGTTAASPASANGNTQRTLSLVVGGVGLTGLAVGAIFGAFSMSAHDAYEKDCGSYIGAPSNRCNSSGVSGQNDAATKGTISTIAFVVGGVAAATGVVLFLTAPRDASSPRVGVGPGRVVVMGQF